MSAADGAPCLNRLDAKGVESPSGGGGAERHAESPATWRDLARRLKAVDEVSFSVPSGDEGWLLAEVVVAAVRWQQLKDITSSDDDGTSSHDPTAHMVQVFPGPRAVIAQVSRAAVLYHADDMLERGLQLRSARALSTDDSSASGEAPKGAISEGQGGDDEEASAQLQLSKGHSVEGLQQLLRALAGDVLGSTEGSWAAKLLFPPHVRKEQLLKELDRLVNALDPAKAEDRVVKKYGHFEAFFAYHWEWLTPTDALEVAFERWRHDPVFQREGQKAFFKGQTWTGSYFCTQGTTALALDVIEVTVQEDGQESLQADLTFTIDSDEKTVRGQYVVAGWLNPKGRVLVLNPVPGSWKDKPKNFVMVGLQGVVSRMSPDGRGSELRFAGSVPIFGCDSFELKAPGGDLEEAYSDPAGEPKLASRITLPPAPDADHFEWKGALARFRQSLEDNRKRWRKELQRLINEKGTSSKKVSAQVFSNKQVQQLVEAAKSSGMVSFEIMTQSGEEIVFRIGR